MLLLPYFLPFFLFLVFFLIAVAVAMAHSQSQSYEEEEGRTIIAITNAFLVLLLFLLSQVLRSPIIEGPFAWLGFPSLCVVLAFISFCFTFEVFLSATHRKPL